MNRVAAQLAIERLLAEVCWAMDSNEHDLMRTLYTTDCVHISPPLVEGGEPIRIEGVEELVTRQKRGATLLRGRQHTHSNVLVDFDADGADVRSYLVVTVLPAHDDTLVKLGLRMRYRVVRSDGGWQIASSEQEIVWRENDAVLMSGLQTTFVPHDEGSPADR